MHMLGPLCFKTWCGSPMRVAIIKGWPNGCRRSSIEGWMHVRPTRCTEACGGLQRTRAPGGSAARLGEQRLCTQTSLSSGMLLAFRHFGILAFRHFAPDPRPCRSTPTPPPSPAVPARPALPGAPALQSRRSRHALPQPILLCTRHGDRAMPSLRGRHVIRAQAIDASRDGTSCIVQGRRWLEMARLAK